MGTKTPTGLVPRLAADHFHLSCPATVAAFGASVTCTVTASDREGNFVPGNISVSTEAGQVPQALTLSEVAAPGAGGKVEFVFRAQCPFPRDIDEPDAGTPCSFHNTCADPPGNEERTCNEGDWRGTIMVVADGSEAFTDSNGNGRYDDGEPFVDLSEPHVDFNEDGVADAMELIVDVDDDHAWDGPNGKWDRDTLIWTTAKISWPFMRP